MLKGNGVCDLRTSQGPRYTAPDSCPAVVWAVIADIHGNYPALKAVLEDAKRARVERYLLVGDYFTDLHYTRQVYELLRDLPGALLISGNREWYMGTLDPALRRREQTAGLYLTQRELGEDGLAWVKGLPKTARIATPDGKRRSIWSISARNCTRAHPTAAHRGFPQVR